jgi:hypothetical protein
MPSRKYNAGTTSIFSDVEYRSPYRITIAIGVCSWLPG